MSELLDRLFLAISKLSVPKQQRVETVVRSLSADVLCELSPNSDFVDIEFAALMGDVLQLHHALSREPFTKDKFEFAMEATLNESGHEAFLADKGNPGHDLTVDGVRWSLKTQADSGIKPEQITISKYMELGKGAWRVESDLHALRERMFAHMQGYERIFTLRCLTPNDSAQKTYQLVEIPKSLLLLAADFPCEMKHDSKQTPKPGYCRVEVGGLPAFELYFDGGTERKLQVRKLKVALCHIHSTWKLTI